MKKADILNKVEINFNDIVQTASELIKIPSRNPPGEEKNCAEYIYSKLKEFGYETYLVNEPFNNRPQVVALIKGKNKESTILLNGHIDTVPEGDRNSWSIDPFSGTIKDSFLYGRGAVDMKTSLAIMMHVGKIVSVNGNLLLTFAVGEERAEAGTSSLLSYINKLGLNLKYGLVLEPTSLRVASCQNGATWFMIKVKGRAAHASAPDKGLNAIEVASRIMQRINYYKDVIAKRSHRLAGAPTCTVTMIKGGFKENVIPDACELVIDRRLLPGESSDAAANELKSFLNKLEFDYELEKLGSREPVELDDNRVLVKSMLDVMNETTHTKSKTICFSGASDNEHLIANGIESLVWGPGDLNKAHSIDECISIDEIRQAIVALSLLLNKFLA
ncbi:MAG: M20 family metallopeptidase [Nitrososphaerales archaeon]